MDWDINILINNTNLSGHVYNKENKEALIATSDVV